MIVLNEFNLDSLRRLLVTILSSTWAPTSFEPSLVRGNSSSISSLMVPEFYSPSPTSTASLGPPGAISTSSLSSPTEVILSSSTGRSAYYPPCRSFHCAITSNLPLPHCPVDGCVYAAIPSEGYSLTYSCRIIHQPHMGTGGYRTTRDFW